MTNCPHCKKTINRVNIAEIAGYVNGRPALKTISYNCPLCNCSISMQIDPIAVKTETVAALRSRQPF